MWAAIDVAVTATDKAGEEVTDTFKVTVLNTNDAPTLANAIADQTGHRGRRVRASRCRPRPSPMWTWATG
jgi:hypothetical protein